MGVRTITLYTSQDHLFATIQDIGAGAHRVSVLIRKRPSVSQNHSPPLVSGVDVISERERCERFPGELTPRRAPQRRSVNVFVIATRVV